MGKFRTLSLGLIVLAASVANSFSFDGDVLYDWERKQLIEDWGNYKAQSTDKIQEKLLFEFMQSNAVLLGKFTSAGAIPTRKVIGVIAARENLVWEISERDVEILEIDIAMKSALMRANEFRFLAMEMAGFLFEAVGDDSTQNQAQFREWKRGFKEKQEAKIAQYAEEIKNLLKEKQALEGAVASAVKKKTIALQVIAREKEIFKAKYEKKRSEAMQSVETVAPRQNHYSRSSQFSQKERMQNKLIQNAELSKQRAHFDVTSNEIDLEEAEEQERVLERELQLFSDYVAPCGELEARLEYVINMLKLYDDDHQKAVTLLEDLQLAKYANKISSGLSRHVALKGCMPLLSLFDMENDEEAFLATLDSIGRDLFLDVDYFAALDDEFLGKQMELAQHIFAEISGNEKELFYHPQITDEHVTSVKMLIGEIGTIHELEQKKRKAAKDTEKAKQLITIELATANDVYDAKKALFEMSESSTTASSTVQQPWQVNITKHVNRVKDCVENGAMLDELVTYLASNGPILSVQNGADRLWRNFSALTKNDFHCHVGSSNLVAVWKVNVITRTITMYYLGTHPSSYKRVLH